MKENWQINWKDYYEILQVQPKAEPEVIKGAYEKLARKYHPDLNNSSTATQQMKDINEAYACLSDPNKKSQYDKAYKFSNKEKEKDSTSVVTVVCPKCEKTTELDYRSNDNSYCSNCGTPIECKAGILEAKAFTSSRSQINNSKWDYSIRIKDLVSNEVEIIDFTSIWYLGSVEWSIPHKIALCYYDSKPTILMNLTTNTYYRIAKIPESKTPSGESGPDDSSASSGGSSANEQEKPKRGCGFWLAVILLSIGGLMMISATVSKDASVVVISIVLVVIGFIILNRKNKNITKDKAQNSGSGTPNPVEKERETDIAQCLESIKEGKNNVDKLIITNSPIILQPGEELVVVIPNMNLMEPRSVRYNFGGYGGPSFRISKGVSFRLGAFASRGESHDEVKTIDQGILTITNKRLVFTGKMRSNDTDIIKIIAVEPYKDGIGIKISGRPKAQYYIGLKEGQYKISVQGNNKTYTNEPLTGLWIAYILIGLIKKLQNTNI
jgi:DnaJ domain